jgi:hypothetical protein
LRARLSVEQASEFFFSHGLFNLTRVLKIIELRQSPSFLNDSGDPKGDA